MLRVAVLGAGAHSYLCHGPALQAAAAAGPGDLALAAVCDLDRERAQAYAQAFGFAAVYDDLDAMLAAERLDGLLAITPLPVTASMAERLLPLGIPVLLEKPPGVNAGDTRRLLDIAEATGARHMLSFNRRFSPALQQARAWLAQGGPARRPKLVLARMLRVNRTEPDFVVGTGIHLIDAVLSLLGTPAHLTTTQLPAADAGAHFTQACLDFAGGSRAHLIISPTAGSGEETYEIHGDGYTIHIDTVRCATTIWEGGEEVLAWQAPAEAESAFRDGTVAETAAFLQALRDGDGFAPTLRDGLCAMHTAEAIAGLGRIGA